MIFVWIGVIAAILWFYFNRLYSRFSDNGVKHFKVILPLGNMLPIMIKKEHVAYNLHKMYTTFADQRFIGRYEFINPSVLIRDLELVKKITIKEFEHFIDHRDFTDETIDPLFGRNLFSLRGQEWKEMRTFLSPAFTSSKIRLMVPFIQDVSDQMIRTLKSKLKRSNSSYIEVDSKDLTTRSTNDIIASCAFGMKVDSHMEPENQFYMAAKDATSFKFRQFILFFAYAAFPSLFRSRPNHCYTSAVCDVMRMFVIMSSSQSVHLILYPLVHTVTGRSLKFNITLLSKETSNFFINLVKNTMKNREARNILRPDMIHLLMEAKKGNLKIDDKKHNNLKEDGFAAVGESSPTNTVGHRVWSDVDLVAQAAIFLVAGFETVSTAVTFALFELAINSDVQERLFQEVIEFDERHGGKMDFNAIQHMQYLDMVISEVLRIWPPLTILDRECVRDFNLGKPNSDAPNDFIVQKGEIVIIPVWSFHHDPEYFPDPEKFNPDRFSEENKHLINPLTYLPFGIGPRNCIGSRFALIEVKILLYYIIKNMKVSPSKKTIHPTKLSAESFNLKLNEGHWLRFTSRE